MISQQLKDRAQEVARQMTEEETIVPIGDTGFFVTRGEVEKMTPLDKFQLGDQEFYISWNSAV